MEQLEDDKKDNLELKVKVQESESEWESVVDFRQDQKTKSHKNEQNDDLDLLVEPSSFDTKNDPTATSETLNAALNVIKEQNEVLAKLMKEVSDLKKNKQNDPSSAFGFNTALLTMLFFTVAFYLYVLFP